MGDSPVGPSNVAELPAPSQVVKPTNKLSQSRAVANSYRLRSMKPNTTSLERAFQLAESGQCLTLDSIRVKLKYEGYDTRQMEGRSLSKQLSQIMQKAQANAGRT